MNSSATIATGDHIQTAVKRISTADRIHRFVVTQSGNDGNSAAMCGLRQSAAEDVHPSGLVHRSQSEDVALLGVETGPKSA